MTKKIIFCLSILLVFIFGGISYAAPNPLNGLTQDQVIQKYFEGRQLDLIEGIWLDDEAKPWMIIKSSLIDPNKVCGSFDYLMIEYSSTASSVYEDGVSNTQYASCFKLKGSILRFISPNTIAYLWNYQSGHRIFTRIYPNETKK